MNRLSLCAVCALFLCPTLFAQTYEWGEGRIYNNVKVKLTSGATLRAKRLAVGGSDVLLTSSESPKPVAFPLKNVEQVQVATGNHLLTGLGVGAVGGILAFFVIKETYEKPKTSTYSEPGFTVTVTEQKFMDPGLKALIVSAPVGLGALIGSTIPGKWKTVYSAAPASHNIRWHFALGQLIGQPALGVHVNF